MINSNFEESYQGGKTENYKLLTLSNMIYGTSRYEIEMLNGKSFEQGLVEKIAQSKKRNLREISPVSQNLRFLARPY